jgi:hypothetical protein
MPANRELLDESRLEGVEAIGRGLGPAIQALVVSAEDLPDAGAAIESCCQLWGGALYSLLPLPAGAVQFDEPWLSLLGHLETSWLGTRELGWEPIRPGLIDDLNQGHYFDISSARGALAGS